MFHRISAVEHAGAADIAAKFKTEMLKDPVTPFVTEEYAGEEDRHRILYRSCSGVLTEVQNLPFNREKLQRVKLVTDFHVL